MNIEQLSDNEIEAIHSLGITFRNKVIECYHDYDKLRNGDVKYRNYRSEYYKQFKIFRIKFIRDNYYKCLKHIVLWDEIGIVYNYDSELRAAKYKKERNHYDENLNMDAINAFNDMMSYKNFM